MSAISAKPSTDGNVTDYLKNNPRMIGMLFTLLLLLTQAGNAAAAGLSANAGP